MDELRMYNRALSSGEIYQIYASNFKKIDTSNWLFSVSYSGLKSGIYNYTGTAIDRANNLASTGRTITIQTAISCMT
jgi:hypothetical protein